MRRAYRILLRLYPRDFRASFAREMLDAFDKAAQDRRRERKAVWLRFALAETTGLLFGAIAEWLAKLTTDRSFRGRSLPDLLLMRPPGVCWQDHYRGVFEHRTGPLPEELVEAEKEMEILVIAHHDFEAARKFSRQELSARDNLRVLHAKCHIGDSW